jgi:hypothetical protein
MAKRFFHVCGGVFLLVLSYQLGASRAHGQASFFRLIGPTVAIVDGTAYHLEVANLPYGWRQMPYTGQDLPPVPVSSLVSYVSGIAITDAGEGWYRLAIGWQSLGFLPGGPQPVIPGTWGSVKDRYRK